MAVLISSSQCKAQTDRQYMLQDTNLYGYSEKFDPDVRKDSYILSCYSYNYGITLNRQSNCVVYTTSENGKSDYVEINTTTSSEDVFSRVLALKVRHG